MTTTVGTQDLESRTAIVTGAARGIGEAVARAFAEAGASVVLVSRSEAVLGVANTINRSGGTATALQTDIAEDAAAAHLVRSAVDRYGGIDIVVNNAGTFTPVLPEEADSATFDAVYAVNTKAPLLLASEALPYLEASGHGSVINVITAAVWNGGARSTLYRSSKAALMHITMAQAKAWAARGVRVNAIAPGPIDTEMMGWAGAEARALIADSTALKRFATPGEVVGAFLYLAGDASSYTTGSVLRVDGGMIAT
jgi:NAD(P)-dependent dehydrogenase (short-subunit alcohol dehydrogenase family)